MLYLNLRNANCHSIRFEVRGVRQFQGEYKIRNEVFICKKVSGKAAEYQQEDRLL